ncbi:hypothetical protein [Spirosoma luteum]|uniref:hypothetical protein n=1 Tax=Spirosoma luteum TaxID=431553 RepID=UPI00316AE8A2
MMILFILGLLVPLAGFAIQTPSLSISRFSGPSKVIGLVLMAGGLITASIRPVSTGRVGVVSLFGQVGPSALPAGLNGLTPWPR